MNSKSMLKQKKRKRRNRLLIYSLLCLRMRKGWLIQRVLRKLVHLRQSTCTQIQDKVPITCLKIQSLLARTSWTRLRMTNMDGVGNAQIMASSASTGTCSQRVTSLPPRRIGKKIGRPERQLRLMKRPLKRRSRRREPHCHLRDSPL